MFELNDKVIYPGLGVAVIEDILEKKVGGKDVRFLKLVFSFKDMTILVPTYNIDTIGIRVPSNKDTVKLALNELYKKPEKHLEGIDFTPSGWNRRNKEYQLKIQSGQLIDIAKIYRDLMHIAQQKDLSFGERLLLQATEELLVQELQISQNTDREHVIQDIRGPFKQFIFQDKSYAQESVATP